MFSFFAENDAQATPVSYIVSVKGEASYDPARRQAYVTTFLQNYADHINFFLKENTNHEFSLLNHTQTPRLFKTIDNINQAHCDNRFMLLAQLRVDSQTYNKMIADIKIAYPYDDKTYLQTRMDYLKQQLVGVYIIDTENPSATPSFITYEPESYLSALLPQMPV